MKFSKRTEDIIADFRGLPRTVTTSSRHDPTTLDSLMVMLKERYKLETPSAERSLVENWEHIFGPNLASRCNPVRIKDNHTLIVSVTNPTLRAELNFRKREVLQKIRQLEYCNEIRDLVIRG